MTETPTQILQRATTEIEKIESVVKGLRKTDSSDVNKAKDALNNIATQRKAIKDLKPGADDKGPSQDEINVAKTQIAVLESSIGELLYSTPPFHDNRKLFYQEAGQWGRHFSTVRMTVMTFTISTCAAIVAWNWQGRAPAVQPLMITTAILWSLAVFTFWIFTYHTYKKVRSQKNLRDWMPDGIHGKEANAGDVKLDLASFVVPVFSFGLWFLVYQQRLIMEHWHTAVAWFFIVTSVIVPIGIAAWLKWTKQKFIIIVLVGLVLAVVAGYYGNKLSLLEKASSSEKASQQQNSDVPAKPYTSKSTTTSEDVGPQRP